MAARETYRRQVSLLVRTLPFVAEECCFALKGGTAINLFIRDMPRLSVDIDLTYLPVAERSASLANIDAAMRRIGDRIATGIPDAMIHEGRLHKEGTVNKLSVRAGGVQIKLEVTPVLRGCVFEPEQREVAPTVEATFGYAEATLVSFADLYAGKLVAALDRQHPRDLFDVRDLLANEGIDNDLRTAFVVYLISHNRPMAEVLAPTRQDISAEFESGFVGMTDTPVTLAKLIETREELIRTIVGDMPEVHRNFLIGFEEGDPNWPALKIKGIELLPAVRWRMENLGKLDATRRRELVAQLKTVLNV